MRDNLNVMEDVTAGRLELILAANAPDPGLEALRGLGPKLADRFRGSGVVDQRDLLLFVPRKYHRILKFPDGRRLREFEPERTRMFVEVVSVHAPTRWSRRPLEVIVRCDDVRVVCVWFNVGSRAFASGFRPGRTLIVDGEVDWSRGLPRMVHPQTTWTQQGPPDETAFEFEPVYSSIDGLSQLRMRGFVRAAIDRLSPHLVDVVPRSIREQHSFPPISEAIATIHAIAAPGDPARFEAALERARARLVYEEFFTLQSHFATIVRDRRGLRSAPTLADRELGRAFVRRLPFRLTDDQRDVSKVLADDLARPYPMRRLLQGDVGSGKTVVALAAAAIAMGSGGQVAFMAPTEVLAVQHFATSQALFGDLDVNVALLTGSTSSGERREIVSALRGGTLDLIVGTHALLSDDVSFRQLAFAIVDEQHKFGVEQREALLAKGKAPHLLATTATPIPRSLAHSVFGDLELVVLRSKPAGREPVRTYLRERDRRDGVYTWVADQVAQGRRAYVVFPAIDEGPGGVSHLLGGAEDLANGALRGTRLAVLHGRMPASDKREVLRRFSAGEVDVLCATTVVEVGIDVPEATIMVIESPERFGLSQLHQLRGRVGRGHETSRCILVVDPSTAPDSLERLRAFTTTTDGFQLAEMDLLLRGPGEFTGVRQSGPAEFRFGDLVRDAELLEAARHAARRRAFGDVASG